MPDVGGGGAPIIIQKMTTVREEQLLNKFWRVGGGIIGGGPWGDEGNMRSVN